MSRVELKPLVDHLRRYGAADSSIYTFFTDPSKPELELIKLKRIIALLDETLDQFVSAPPLVEKSAELGERKELLDAMNGARKKLAKNYNFLNDADEVGWPTRLCRRLYCEITHIHQFD